jgi:hypothetical protein
VERAVEYLQQVEAPLVGFVANRASARHQGYYYYHYYYHERDRKAGAEKAGARAQARPGWPQVSWRGPLKRWKALRQPRARKEPRSNGTDQSTGSSRRNGRDIENVPLPAAWLVSDTPSQQDARATQPLRIPRGVERGNVDPESPEESESQD